MSQLQVMVKFNDGKWRPQKFPQFYNEDTVKAGQDVFNMLSKFNDLDYIQDFKVYIIKYDDKGNKYRIDIKDILERI